MLSIGINLVTRDYNRKTELVYHLLDDVTGKFLPICGADLLLTDDGDAGDLVERIRRRDEPLFESASSRMCGRCKRACVGQGTEEEKSERRLARWKRKEARSKLVKAHEETVRAKRIGRCPKCLASISVREPLGYGDVEADCDSCGLKWTFSMLVRPSGQFTVWADDSTEQHSGIARSHVMLEEITWEWR